MSKKLFQSNINLLAKVGEFLRIPATMSGSNVIMHSEKNLAKLQEARDHVAKAIKALEEIE